MGRLALKYGTLRIWCHPTHLANIIASLDLWERSSVQLQSWDGAAFVDAFSIHLLGCRPSERRSFPSLSSIPPVTKKFPRIDGMGVLSSFGIAQSLGESYFPATC